MSHRDRGRKSKEWWRTVHHYALSSQQLAKANYELQRGRILPSCDALVSCACSACKLRTGMALVALMGGIADDHPLDQPGLFITVEVHNGGPFTPKWNEDEVYDDEVSTDDDEPEQVSKDPNIRIV
jgi:hypothetical protein